MTTLSSPAPETMPAAKPGRFKLPDIYIVLSVFMLVMAALTYIVPAGRYERQPVQTPQGVREVVVAGTYKQIEQHPVGFMDLVTAIPDGLARASGVVFLTFLVGAGVGVIRRAGLIDIGIQKLTGALGDKEILIIPLMMVLFGTLAAFIGTPELALAYLPVLLPLFYRLGYDGMTATAVAMLGPCTGFIFGITIPASVGMGQVITQLPMFSGSGFRAVVLVIAMLMAVGYTMVYARRVKKDPSRSLTLETDRALRDKLGGIEVARIVPTTRQLWAGYACFVMFPASIVAILVMNLGFAAIGGLFLLMGIVAAAIAGKGPQEICDDLNASMRDIMVAALLCGVASAIAVVMDKGVITDTLVYYLESFLRTVPSEVSAIGIFWVQSVFNILVPSASALTLLTMPVLSPLGTLLDIPQQVVVTANAWGGQLTDIFFPTSGFFVATLMLAKVEYSKWVRFYFPLMLAFGVMASLALVIQRALGG